MRLFIKEAREKVGLSQKSLAEMLGIPANTFNGYETGKHDPKSELLIRIAKCCDCTTDFLLGLPEKQNSAPSFSNEALLILDMYEAAEPVIKAAVKAVLEAGASSTAPSSIPNIVPISATPKRRIPHFAAAGGKGDPASDVAWDYYETEDQLADFAVRVVGDSMEPYIHDGADVLGTRRMPRDGEIGVFRLDGEFLVKQVCTDSQGNVYLFALNRAREDADQTIWHDAGRDLWCFGTVLMPRMPLP